MKSWVSACLLLAACGSSLPEPAAPPQPPSIAARKIGSGYIDTELPNGEGLPSDSNGKPDTAAYDNLTNINAGRLNP